MSTHNMFSWRKKKNNTFGLKKSILSRVISLVKMMESLAHIFSLLKTYHRSLTLIRTTIKKKKKKKKRQKAQKSRFARLRKPRFLGLSGEFYRSSDATSSSCSIIELNHRKICINTSLRRGNCNYSLVILTLPAPNPLCAAQLKYVTCADETEVSREKN